MYKFGIGKANGQSEKILGKALNLDQCSLMVKINEPKANAAMIEMGSGFLNCTAVFDAKGVTNETSWKTSLWPGTNLEQNLFK